MKKILRSTLMAVLCVVPFFLQSMAHMPELDERCKSFVDAAGDRAVVFIEDEMREGFLDLHKLFPDYSWSDLFQCLCKDMQEEGNLILHEQMVKIVDECLGACQQELSENGAEKQGLVEIATDLQDYQEFLSCEKTPLDARNTLLTKRGSCRVKPCSNSLKCFDLKALVVNGDDILPFLPTGPSQPIPAAVDNYFYATKRSQQGQAVPNGVFPPVQFDDINSDDGSWALVSGTDFTAQISGIFLFTIVIPFTATKTVGNTSSLLLGVQRGPAVISNTSQQLKITNVTAAETEDVLMALNFIAQVNSGDVLEIFAIQGGANFFTYSNPDLDSGWNNGSITIVRIK